MKTIRIDDVVWAYLQSRGKPFEDSPNDVLLRELKLNANGHQKGDELMNNHDDESMNDENDYSFRSVSGFSLKGRNFPARSFKDVLVTVSNHLRGLHGSDFDKFALKLHGTKRSYFSQDAGNLKFSEQLSGKGLFVETNLSANLIVKICRRLLKAFGYGPQEFQIN